jgi:hypothetical protein
MWETVRDIWDIPPIDVFCASVVYERSERNFLATSRRALSYLLHVKRKSRLALELDGTYETANVPVARRLVNAEGVFGLEILIAPLTVEVIGGFDLVFDKFCVRGK